MTNISTAVDLVINRLSQAKYEQLCVAGQLEENQLYMTTGEADITAQISDYYYLKSETSSAAEISSALKQKSSVQIVVKESDTSSSLSTFVINNVTQQEYLALSAAGQTVSSELYVIDPDSVNLDARGDWVTNVKTPELSSDAANKAYVDSQLSNAGGGFSFETYKPAYDIDTQSYVIKPGKLNILSVHLNNNDNLIFEDYSVDQVYKVQLTGNADTAVSVNLLVDSNQSDVLPGAYSDPAIASCFTVAAPKQVYNFEVSYGNVTFDNDVNGDSLRTMYPYPNGARQYGDVGYDRYAVMPLNNACNHLSVDASDTQYDGKPFDVVIPCRVRTSKVRRMRQFSIAVKSEFAERGMQLVFPTRDMNGGQVSYTFICGAQYAKTPRQGDVITFKEFQKDKFYVDIQNINQNLWYQFVTPTPHEGVVTMKDRCINYVNIKTTATSTWEWSDGSTTRQAPVFSNGTWSSPDGSYVVQNSDAGQDAAILYVYPDPNNIDDSTLIICGLITSYVINSGNGTIAMPPQVAGRSRDFLLRMRIDTSSVPNINFTGAHFETESGYFPELNEGAQVLSFTEVKAGTFMIGYKKLEVAS